jgi:hypothetical protein
MKIADIIKNGNGTAGAWRVDQFRGLCTLYHYSTAMLTWNPETGSIYCGSTGWGSVSDQNGMNTAFRIIDADYAYRRNGGDPRIEYCGERITL